MNAITPVTVVPPGAREGLGFRPTFGDSCHYMEWAQFKPRADFQLANSAIRLVPITRLGNPIEYLDTVESADGSLIHRSAIARRHGVHENQVVPASGTTQANLIAMMGLIQPGDQVLVEWPGYEPIADAAVKLGASLSRIPRQTDNQFKLDLNALSDLVTPNTKLTAITNLHNPSSARLSPAELEQVVQISTRHGGYLLVDEVYLGAVDDKSAIHSQSNRVLVSSSLAKFPNLSYLREGWLLCPRELWAHLQSVRDLIEPVTAPPLERMQEQAWKIMPELEQEALDLMRQNIATWHSFVDAHENQIFDCKFDAGTIAFPRLLRAFDRSVEQLNDYLLGQSPSVGIVPGHRFGAPTHFRVCLGLPNETLKAGLEALSFALSKRADWERG